MNESKEMQARKNLLLSQVEHAFAEEDKKNKGYYRVFVPGAFREYNVVKADSEKEAIEKTRDFLVTKSEQLATEQVYSGSEEPTDGEVEVSPDNMKLKMKAVAREEVDG